MNFKKLFHRQQGYSLNSTAILIIINRHVSYPHYPQATVDKYLSMLTPLTEKGNVMMLEK
jgi:membrane-bound acyltransferase YfiQ involved in biofilm formation